MRHSAIRLALIGVASLLPAAVNAADLKPVYKAPPPADSTYNWTGWYFGVNAGYTWSDNNNVSYVTTDTGDNGLSDLNGLFPAASLSNKGFIGGGQAGYNWQAGVWVWGIEADIQWVNAGENFTSTVSAPGIPTFTTTLSRDLEWFGTVRGRAGVTVTPMLLAYATGGFAYGKTNFSAAYFIPTASPVLNLVGTDSGTSTGWTVGGGLEWAVGNGWSVKGEYLYYDLGTSSVFGIYDYGAFTSTVTTSIDNTGHIMRAGLNYKFPWGKAPVMAKY